MVQTSSQFSADIARKSAFVPRLEKRFLIPRVFLIGFRIVEIVEAVLERDLVMFIIWVDVPGALGSAVMFEVTVDAGQSNKSVVVHEILRYGE
mmetsp:Transcript_14008/g.21274  ORF Transcript_14008/g.21274 Transcript_14008/m.21274 type:complete len:93 (+) Transcript_14008:1064-1342(+)